MNNLAEYMSGADQIKGISLYSIDALTFVQFNEVTIVLVP